MEANWRVNSLLGREKGVEAIGEVQRIVLCGSTETLRVEAFIFIVDDLIKVFVFIDYLSKIKIHGL